MESSLENQSGTKQKRKESFEETQKNLRKALDELKNLLKEGKDQNDLMVKDTEDRIRVALDVPKESWAQGQTLKDLIENLNSNLNALERSSFSLENISDEDVLKTASGGLCLQGVYKSGNLEDLLEKRQQLIEIPESFSLCGPEQSAVYEQKEFSSHKSESVFQKAMERLGSSLTIDFKVGFWGFSLENTTNVKNSHEEEKSNVQSCEQSHVYCIKYNYVPLASSFLGKEKLKLLDGAIQELKSIETILLNSNDKEVLTRRVVNFFKRFGSHVNQGPIHFGGVFWWRASAEGVKTSELSEVKSLTSDALNVYVGAAYSGLSRNFSAGVTTTSTQLKGALQRNYNEALMSQVCLSVQKTGGPAHIDDHIQWKSHLVTNNKNWSVIDRGTTFVPVWEIIMAAHSDVFQDAYSLATCLREIFSDVTNQSVEQMWGENILSAVESARKMIQTVKDWRTSEGDAHLMELLDLKKKLKNEMGSDETWVETCLSNPILQNFLLYIVIENKNEQAINLRFLMRALLEPHNAVKNFSDKSEIMKWAYQPEENVNTHIPVSDIPELIKILKQKKEELEGQCAFSSSEHRSSTVKATCTVTNSLHSLCRTLSDQQQHETELLVLSSIDALGYCCESKTFNHLLDWNEINFLQNEIERSYKEYCSLKEQNVSKAQAYVFWKVLTLSKDEEYISSEKKEARLELIKSHLKDNISNAIKLLVEESHGNWELLEEELNSFIRESNMKEENTNGEDTASQLGSLPANQVSLSEDTTDFTNIPASDTAMNGCTSLLKKLGLSDLFPKKIKLNDILVIDSLSLCLSEPDTVEDLKSQYLYKLMILDYNVRYLSFKPVATGSLLEDDGTAFDDFDFFNTNEETTRGAELADTESHIHPMDIHMAVFHCANDFLRQYMYTKLSACQFALPFLVPNPGTEDLEFPLWPLRHIKKSWKSMTSADNPGKYQTRQMFSTPVAVVSFLRLGTSFTSKSQILNSVISKQRHNVFFNRHCKGSAPNSMLMNGVVEIAWYCPGGKKDDIFDDCVAFLNLHGEAKEHRQQLKFLQAVSTVNVLLLSEQPQDEETKTICQNLSQSPVPLICLFSGSERVQGSKNPLKVRLAAKNRNEAELTEELITNIKQCIAKSHKKQSIGNCSNEARKLKFNVDEDKQSFKDGHALAQTLVCLLKEKHISDIKKEFLPLHGELWHNWCLKNKQRYRLSCKTNETIEQQKSVILSDMKATRQKQRKTALSHNDFMRSFLDYLTSSEHAEDTKFYMLQWLRVLLDESSSDDLAKLEENYHSAWSQMKNVPKTKEKAEELDMLSKQLNSISEKMAASTIGLQHIMREVGQMYECSVNQPVAALPALGAEMLISGYPLELMDGDESHVPLIWVQAVLKSLIDKLGDKKVYVLSILGLQSSGKSTLLNTMFGLQFTVSAGRCTRGAFMQMIKVDEKIREEFGFDFLLVVDTEGLRSPELSTKTSLNHDNELATFIIGVGDMTVINIMGENPSEMHEILQICVQAFLRMKRVEIKPSCIFVHQNVAEASAGDKNMEGRRRLQEKLDEMAQTAAKEEGIDDVYRFGDVIQFDLESQVFYFKNLLEGDPPMAPPNPSYSQNVQDLKSKLLSVARWHTGFRFPSLSQFRLRVHDLWNALLQENFVFSFRNTLEIMVYSSLEEKYGQWSWKLRKCSLETQTKLENQIGSNNISDVNTTDLISAFDEVYTGLKREIEAHFKEDKHAEILIKWKGNVENRLESLKNELIEETHKQCKMLTEVKRGMSELDQKKSLYEKNLMQKSKTMATSLKLKDKRLTDKQVEEAFNSLWVEWVAEIAKDQLPDKPVHIKATVEGILCSRFQKQADIMNKIKIISEKGTFEFTKKKHISQSSMAAKWESFKETFGKGILQEFAEKLHRNVNHMVDEYIRKKEMEKTDFNNNFIFEILGNVERHIQECERNENVKFTYEYRVDLSVLVCHGSVQRFQKMHESFKKANNPVTYLQSKREQYFQMFQNYCKGANSVRIFSEFLFKNILPAVEEAIYNKTKVQIADDMKCNKPAISGNRCNLENHILRHLAIQKKFEFYDEYIHNPKSYFKTFIGEHVETFCGNYKELQVMLRENLKEIKLHILRTSKEASDEVNLKNGNASMWLDHFCTKLGDHMVINRQSLTSIQDEDISDTEFLKEMMAKYLEQGVKSENMEKVDASSQHLCLLKEKTTEILFNQLEGCWAQCPFCKAICTNTITNHSGDHRVQFHRSAAIGHFCYHETDEFSIDFCTTKVSSDSSFRSRSSGNWIPYKSYRDAGDPYDKWSITADGSTQGYWKWFVCRFQKEWEDRCELKFKGRGVIPDSWREITEESVLEELNIRD
ncbi:interferon-induced very large GTPase 1-like [Paramormyrops kingsleyae]|uniref:interferon-induced very large GTPase 1-like n=1 Tax=Paramormyrops kingsleyae TaxID=1676925 RepID=UPI003B9713DA